MILLLLLHFLTQSNRGGDASPIHLMERQTDISCNNPNNCRNVWNVIWSCLSTVFLCTWVTLHPNITIPPETRGMRWFGARMCHLRHFLKNKLVLFLWALFVPEYILGWSIRQHLAAGDIQQECYTRQTSTHKHLVPVRKWTRAHGFFVVMGGFHLYTLPDGAASIAFPPESSITSNFVLPLPGHSREGETAERPLGFKDLSPCALAYLAPTGTELTDRSKADVIAKTLVLLQTLWFVAQCIARGAEHLPLTELEIVTLAYAMINLFTYYFWWDKPKDVQCPIRVYKAGVDNSSKPGDATEIEERTEWGKGLLRIFTRTFVYVLAGQDDFFRLSEETQVPMFWSGKPGGKIEGRAMFGASVLGMAFAAIHFIAWNSEFPSQIELLLWRTSCVTMVAVPLAVTILCGIWEVDPEIGARTWSIVAVTLGVVACTLPLIVLLYLFARIATLVMAFTTLREMLSDAFKIVDWAILIPHL